MVVNHARNKRAAHTIHRSSTEQWNPFRHVSWTKDGRRETWGGRELEEQPIDNAERLRHVATAPTSSSTMPSHDDTVAGSARESDDVTRVRTGEKVVSSPSVADNQSGIRNRKAEDEAARLVASPVHEQSPVDDNGKGKDKGATNGGFFRNVRPSEPFTVANQLQRTLLSSWINVLIIAAPAGIAIKYAKVDGTAVFVVNFVAIIPLAAMLSFATEEVALRTGEVLGGLINATFGNAVELIVAVIALKDKKIAIVQTSLIGSILSNLLLVMGFCFFFGGLRRPKQHFNTTVAQTAASLLALAAASVIVPSVFEVAAPNVPQSDIAKLSRGTSVILLIVYAAYLFFQLKTHQQIFNEQSEKVPAKPWRRSLSPPDVKQGLAMPGAGFIMAHGIPDQNDNRRLSRMLIDPRRLDKEGGGEGGGEGEGEGDDPQLHFFVALATLAISTAIIAICAEAMVDSIDVITKKGGLKEEFVGLILLPIVGNAAEHATAVTVAMKDKMDLAIGVAVGSSMQVALFLIPFLVIIGWGMGEINMDLSFDLFQVAVMFVAVLLTNYLIADGQSHWLEGLLLICLYAIIGICSFWYPDNQLDKANSGATNTT